jgi:putative ABC transport system substrate-binding protein
MPVTIGRRDLIAALGGTAAAWPLAARAQQPDRMRRIGMLWIIAETDPQATKNREAFLKQLHQLGWRAGDNVHIDHRSAADIAKLLTSSTCLSLNGCTSCR